MLTDKMKSTAFISPAGINPAKGGLQDKYALYKEEKDLIKKRFASLGNNINWKDKAVDKELQEFARQVINYTSLNVIGTPDLISVILPTETISPGDTFKLREIHGVNIHYGTYGASVRMSRPQFTEYSQTTNLKEVGLKLDLTQIRTGKYSPSELADYTSALITAWRNNLLFRTTLGGMTAFQSGGAQYQSGTSTAIGTVNSAIDKLTDEGDVAFIVGRRKAIHTLSSMNGWSETGKEQFEKQGQVGTYAGMPVMKVNSFTDPDYGTVYPMESDQLWLFSAMPAGRMVQADALRTADEIILRNESMNMYFRWDDGIGIFYPNRIALLDNMT